MEWASFCPDWANEATTPYRRDRARILSTVHIPIYGHTCIHT